MIPKTIVELIKQFETYLLVQKRARANTVAAYILDLAQFCLFLDQEKLDIKDITAHQLRLFVQWLHNRHLGSRSIARKISTLKALYVYLAQNHGIENITRALVFPKQPKKLPTYLTASEIESLLNAADNDTSMHALRNRTLLYVLYASGMRVSELAGLRIQDILFQTGCVTITGKGGKQRMIPLPRPIMDIVQHYIDTILKPLSAAHECEIIYLFPIWYGKTIKPITRQNIWIIVRDLWKKTGSARVISPHLLRHSLATHLLSSGANLRSLQLLLGHEQLATVQIYTHVQTGHLRVIYDKRHPRS